MSDLNYTKTIAVEIPAEEAARRIAQVADWWDTTFDGRAQKVGDYFTISPGDTFVALEVVESLPDTRIVWRVTDSHLPWIANKEEWKDTQIVWELSTDGAMTTVRMTHVGIMQESECYAVCQSGWDRHLENLRLQLDWRTIARQIDQAFGAVDMPPPQAFFPAENMIDDEPYRVEDRLLTEYIEERRNGDFGHLARSVQQELYLLSPQMWFWFFPNLMHYILAGREEITEYEFAVYYLKPQAEYEKEIIPKLSLFNARHLQCVLDFLHWSYTNLTSRDYFGEDILQAISFVETVKREKT